MLQKISVSNKCYYFYISIHKIILKIFSSTPVFNIDHNEKFLHVWMISEGSCDPEDWSNACWKFRMETQV